MLTSLVTYKRPQAATRMLAHLLGEPGTGTVVVVDNGGLGEVFRGRQTPEMDALDEMLASPADVLVLDANVTAWPPRQEWPRLVVIRPGSNLGAGGGRNLALQARQPGEPFIRIDDDWLPDFGGWLQAAREAQGRTGCGLVRVSPALQAGVTTPRLPDAPGPIWLVPGDVADALGHFYLGFGKTLLDDLEYSRRVVAFCNRAERPVSLIDLDWRVSDLCAVQRDWNPPWDLFLKRCEKIADPRTDLYVPFQQPAPGSEWRDAGRQVRELKGGVDL